MTASPYLVGALLFFLIVNVALRLILVFRTNLNWDEFHYLSFVYNYLDSRPLPLNQTFHVHFFSWLPAVASASEPTQLMIARVLMLTLSVGTGFLIYSVGLRFFSTRAALFAALAYFSLSEVMIHGASFRPDPTAAFLGMTAIWVVSRARSPTFEAVAGGLLVGVSILLTSKSIFWLPALAVLAVVQSPRSWTRCGAQLMTLGGTVVGTVLLLSTAHRSTLAGSPDLGSSLLHVGQAARKVLGGHGFFPRRWYFVRSLLENPLIWLLLLGGILIAGSIALSRRPDSLRAMALLGLGIPLFTILLYRNAFPYFYVFAVAPASLLCGLTFEKLGELRAKPPLKRTLLSLIVIAVFVGGVVHFREYRRPMQAAQRQLISTVHRMFPEPVPYIDRCSMISSFPKVGFFMSSWGMENYRAGLYPSLATVVRQEHPVFLLANTAPLDLRLPEQLASRLRFRLTTLDRQVLRENYVHHWGIIFVAGKNLDFTHTEELEFEILIPGSYTLEAQESLYVDGQRLAPGQSTYFGPGSHVAKASTATRAVLRWGEQLYRPPEAPIGMPIFVSF